METKEMTVTTISELTKAEIDIQIATANRYPRSIKQFRDTALSMATLDIDTASSCFYKLKRKGENGKAFIEGPSVRLAEICASAWKNIRYGARIVEDNGKEVIAQGVCHDLEQNVSTTIEVSRRVTRRDGSRYSDDMVQVTKNAACSIALRNAIFKTIPFTYIKQIYEEAKIAAIGNVKTLGERRQHMILSFAQMRVSKEQILKYVDKKSIEDVGLAEIETLIGVYNAIKNGDTSIDEQFNEERNTAIEDPWAKKETPEAEIGSDKKPASQNYITTIKKIIDSLGLTQIQVDAYLVDYGVTKVDDISESQAKEMLTLLSQKMDEKK